MKKIAIVLAACVLAAGAARPARAQEPTPARMAAAERLIGIMGMKQSYPRTLDMMIEQQVKQNPQVARFEGLMRQFFDRYISWDLVKGDFQRVYALTYTEDEMRQLGEFYQTPLGKRVMETVPELALRTSEITQRRVMDHMPELMQQMMEQMQAGAKPVPGS